MQPSSMLGDDLLDFSRR